MYVWSLWGRYLCHLTTSLLTESLVLPALVFACKQESAGYNLVIFSKWRVKESFVRVSVYPIMTKQKLFFTEVFRPFTRYFVEAPLTAITASSGLGYDASSLAHLYLGSFSHSSLQILSSSVRLDENFAAQLFSGLSRDVRSCSSPGSGWATQGHSKTCPEVTPAWSWLWA